MALRTLPRRATRRLMRHARAPVRLAHGVSYRRRPQLVHAWSQGCTFDQITSPKYLEWCERLRIRPLHHRKQWEWIYILQVLEEHGMLEAGRRGLGFGVGTEPLTAYAAGRGASIVATDLPADAARAEEWRESDQHADELADLNAGGLCPDDVFRANVTFRPVDMRAIPDELTGFDFVWSSCALEHLGSLSAGLAFVERTMACINPGGLAVHTTEYNVAPLGPTLEHELVVAYQRPHLEQLTYDMRRRGHHMKTTFALGDRTEDLHVDVRPFTNTHLRTETLGHVHTSFGMWVRRGP